MRPILGITSQIPAQNKETPVQKAVLLACAFASVLAANAARSDARSASESGAQPSQSTKSGISAPDGPRVCATQGVPGGGQATVVVNSSRPPVDVSLMATRNDLDNGVYHACPIDISSPSTKK